MRKHVITHLLTGLVLLALISIQGCSFHLRGGLLSHSLKSLYVVSKDPAMTTLTENAFKNSGVTIEHNAPYKIEIIDFTTDTINQSFSMPGVSASTLSARVTWVLKTASGQSLFTPRINHLTIDTGVNDGNITTDEVAIRSSLNTIKKQIALSIATQISAISEAQLTQMKREVHARKPSKVTPGKKIKAFSESGLPIVPKHES